MAITGRSNYFEHFKVGDIYEHARGRTVINWDNYALTHLSMNTASAHFDIVQSMSAKALKLRERIVAGPCTLNIVVGLTTEDMSENAFMDVAITGIRLLTPVFQGDTLYARSEVLELSESGRSDAGLMRYRFTGLNQDGKDVAMGERTVLLKRFSHWGQRDLEFGRAVS